MHGFCRLLLLALWHFQWSTAIRIRPNAYCVDGCVTAVSYINFTGSAGLDYYEQTCDFPLFVESLVYCSLIYCSSSDVQPGLEAANDTCKAYSSYSFDSYDRLVSGINPGVLANTTRVAEGDTKQYSQPAVPAKDAFEIALRTESAYDSNINESWYFGYACIGYWALVLLIGMINRFIVFLRHHWTYKTHNAASRPLYLPISISVWLRKSLILPGTFGSRMQQSYGGWCTIPPRLESLLLLLFIAMNTVFFFPAYELFAGNLYFPTTPIQVSRYVADRAGILAISKFPVIWLFAARNDPFLWLTGWSFAAYNRFHRWVARVATAEALVHAVSYSVNGGLTDTYVTEWAEQYWYMGVIAFISMCVLLGTSIYWLREKCYDLFRIIHIALALLSLVALWYHVDIFANEYSPFIYPCIAFWAFDWFLRLVRILWISVLPWTTRGVATIATYSPEADLIRLDVTDYQLTKTARPGIFYFLYEPGSLRGYESHPFTLCSWTRGTPMNTCSSTSSDTSKGFQASTTIAEEPASCSDAIRHTFLVRPYAGFTSRLRDKLMKSSEAMRIHLLYEGPYGEHVRLQQFTDVLVVAGGSGITAAISHSCALLQNPGCTTEIRIVWAVRELALVEDLLRNELSSAATHARVRIDIYHTPVKMNEKWLPANARVMTHEGRPDIEAILAADREQCGGSMAMVCCGPPELADVCRSAVVSQLGQAGPGIEFVNDSMSW